MENLMNVREVAEYLRVHEMTVYRWFKNKKLPSFKVGGVWRTTKSLIDNHVMPEMEDFKV